MKRNLSLLLVSAMLLSGAAAAFAETAEQSTQDKVITRTVRKQIRKEKMMPGPEVQLKRLAKGLKLTEEQQKQIRPVLEEEYAQLKVIRQNEDLSPKQIQKQVEELRTATIAKMQSFMTPEQKTKHDQVSKEIKANKQQRIKENRRAKLGTKADPPKQSTK